MATMNAGYPAENPWSTSSALPRRKDSIHDTPTSYKDVIPFLSLSFPSQGDYGVWNPSPMTPNRNARSSALADSWTSNVKDLDKSYSSSFLEIPQDISFSTTDWQQDDDVSVLHDNPEEDDIEVLYLPRSTYDVLMPLFDELYISKDDDHNDDEQKKQQNSQEKEGDKDDNEGEATYIYDEDESLPFPFPGTTSD